MNKSVKIGTFTKHYVTNKSWDLLIQPNGNLVWYPKISPDENAYIGINGDFVCSKNTLASIMNQSKDYTEVIWYPDDKIEFMDE